MTVSIDNAVRWMVLKSIQSTNRIKSMTLADGDGDGDAQTSVIKGMVRDYTIRNCWTGMASSIHPIPSCQSPLRKDRLSLSTPIGDIQIHPRSCQILVLMANL
jgi:hypothetical protein